MERKINCDFIVVYKELGNMKILRKPFFITFDSLH